MTAIYKETPVTLRESAALTDAFVATTASLDVSQAARADVFLDYTKGGSATALEFYAERQFAGDTAWYTGASETVGTPSGGAVAVTLNRPVYTVGATEKFTLSLPTYGASALRLRVKETGTPGGTLAVTGVAVRVGA